MFYRFTLVVPANTPEDDPVRLDVKLTHGIIHRVEIGFPPGLAGLVHVAIFEREHQLWPTNPGEWFAWDNYNVAFDEEYYMLEAPYELSIRGWSEDDTYDQPVVVRIGLMPIRGPIRALLPRIFGR